MQLIALRIVGKFKVLLGSSNLFFFCTSSLFLEYMLLRIISSLIDQNLSVVSPDVANIFKSVEIYKFNDP